MQGMKTQINVLCRLLPVLAVLVSCVCEDENTSHDAEVSDTATDQTGNETDSSTESTAGADASELNQSSQLRAGTCGDGIVQVNEECDPMEENFHWTCAPYGYFGGVVKCDLVTCTLDLSECVEGCVLGAPGCYCRERCDPPVEGYECKKLNVGGPPSCVLAA